VSRDHVTSRERPEECLSPRALSSWASRRDNNRSSKSRKARAEAFAEVLGDEATDCGLCLGTLGLTGGFAGLLLPSDVLVNGFRNDFWIILRRADAVSLERLVQYLTMARPPRSWHFIGTSMMASSSLLRGLSPAGKRRVAVVEVD
jgi:hypothetical protein